MQNEKKVVVLLGSPRKKGNSTALAKQIIHGAESSGAMVETIYLNGLNIKPCQGCYSCRKPNSRGCVVDDDMQTVYPKVQTADRWVIASPVYWFSMSAQTKLFMDRCFAMFKETGQENYLLNKRIAIAMSYGDTDAFNSGCVNALRSFQDAYRYAGAKIIGMVYGSAEEPGEITSNTSLMKQAQELGSKLMQS
ncbi:MAG: flavodoxin family protein [Deltaproteobacteria bacterium]|jgi:multimeric flavodoxin WrbA|nr:flavodoxin family protein [Deltaproteobacteria bacterium]